MSRKIIFNEKVVLTMPDDDSPYKKVKRYYYGDTIPDQLPRRAMHYVNNKPVVMVAKYKDDNFDDIRTKKFNELLENTDDKDILVAQDLHFGHKSATWQIEDVANKINSMLTENSVVVILGDIADNDDLVKDARDIKKMLSLIKTDKIGMCLGNNDLLMAQEYIKLGFMAVSLTFETSKYIFSHMPLDSGNKLNIHGHLHGSLWLINLPQKNHFDAQFRVSNPNSFHILTPQTVYSMEMINNILDRYSKNISIVDRVPNTRMEIVDDWDDLF